MGIRDWQGENRDRTWWLRALAFAVVLGVILGVLGPFGSFLNGDISLRLVGWIGNMVGGTVIYGFCVPPVLRLLIRLGLPRLPALAVAIAVLTVPGATFAALYGHWLWPQAVARVRPIDWYVQSLIIAIAVVCLWVLLELARESLMRPPTPQPVQQPDSTEPVLCLQMEDHYVRIHRASGSRLELMTLQQAMQKATTDGLQVHRSWWVAASAVTTAERDGRNWRLRLTNGLSVPVARNRITDARARGWITED